MLRNILGSKTTTLIGFILGLLTFALTNGGGIIPAGWVGTLGIIVTLGQWLIGGASKDPNAR